MTHTAGLFAGPIVDDVADMVRVACIILDTFICLWMLRLAWCLPPPRRWGCLSIVGFAAACIYTQLTRFGQPPDLRFFLYLLGTVAGIAYIRGARDHIPGRQGWKRGCR